jgi:hypothetical protein
MIREFETRGYAILRSVIDSRMADIMNGYALNYAGSGKTKTDRQVPGAPAAYAAPLMEKALVKLVPVVEEAAGCRVYPTYSYFRAYRRNDELARHKDRPACEISLSVCLGYRAAQPWPLYVEGHGGVFAAELQPGDGLLYKGTECPHWREPFTGESATQVFFHYVDRDGPYAEWRFDKREVPGGLTDSQLATDLSDRSQA